MSTTGTALKISKLCAILMLFPGRQKVFCLDRRRQLSELSVFLAIIIRYLLLTRDYCFHGTGSLQCWGSGIRCLFDPWIRGLFDPGILMRIRDGKNSDPGGEKIRIRDGIIRIRVRDKHPGSATLASLVACCASNVFFHFRCLRSTSAGPAKIPGWGGAHNSTTWIMTG